MALRRPAERRKGEPTIALINIVFLMLIFFMIAGALAPPLDARVELVDTADLDGRAPPDAAVVLADGSLLLREQPVDAAAVVARAREQDPASDAPAVRLVHPGVRQGVLHHGKGGEARPILTEALDGRRVRAA